MSESLLVAAKSEYTEQLQEILCENIYNGIKTIWNSCKQDEKINTLKCFQKKLCSIPEWNQEIINKIFKTILNQVDVREDYIDKIIEAVFLSNVKILSVVKNNNKSHKINVSIPDTRHFIHRCYIESARCFYSDPFLIDDREKFGNTTNEIQRNIKRSMNIIKISIEKTIRSMIPMEDILKEYLENEEYEPTYEKPKSIQEEPELDEPPEEQPQEDRTQDVDEIFNEQPQNERPPTPVQQYGPFMEQPPVQQYGPFMEQQPQVQQPVQQQQSPLVVNLQKHNDDEDFFD